jgi:hypothetical protein
MPAASPRIEDTDRVADHADHHSHTGQWLIFDRRGRMRTSPQIPTHRANPSSPDEIAITCLAIIISSKRLRGLCSGIEFASSG